MSKEVNWAECAPPGGWKSKTYYVVTVTFNAANPMHRAILYTGFWDDKKNQPGGYSSVFNGSYSCGRASPHELHTVWVISEIKDMAP